MHSFLYRPDYEIKAAVQLRISPPLPLYIVFMQLLDSKSYRSLPLSFNFLTFRACHRNMEIFFAVKDGQLDTFSYLVHCLEKDVICKHTNFLRYADNQGSERRSRNT